MLDRLQRDLEQLGNIGKDPRGGVTRVTFSKPDLEARKFLTDLMKDVGLEVRTDMAANIVGIREGEVDSPYVSSGSHIDTGTMWGIFDGPLGVLGAIEAVRIMNDRNIKTRLPIAIFSFTDEEGTYLTLGGSKYFTGLISKQELYKTSNRYDGTKFGDRVGHAISNNTVERLNIPIKNHVELHIEQGPILEAEKLQLGVVTGIVGIKWIDLAFRGRQSHAGATPLEFRQDPTIPASKTVLAVRDIALKFKEMVATCGKISVTPNVMNAIPGEVKIGVDLRSLDLVDLDHAAKEIIERSKKSAIEEGCELFHSISNVANPEVFSTEVTNVIKQSTEFLGYSYRLIPSRAGHDSQNLTHIAKVGMIFVPSERGISHSPLEWTDFDQAHLGVEVLEQSLVKLAQSV